MKSNYYIAGNGLVVTMSTKKIPPPHMTEFFLGNQHNTHTNMWQGQHTHTQRNGRQIPLFFLIQKFQGKYVQAKVCNSNGPHNRCARTVQVRI